MKRASQIEHLKSDHFDLLVIGGGITGVGIALDAQSRGLKTALIEMDDFASGTSSKSTKLIHGGLRYLKQMEFGLVSEVGKERAIVHRIAPHLVHPDKMLLPLIRGGNYGKWLTSIGLKIYDWLANVKSIDRRRMLNRKETAAAEPLLRTDILEGGGLYAEYRTDDSRMVVSIAKTAKRIGALVMNYVSAASFVYEDGQIVGVHAKDENTGTLFDIQATCVVNATGPWVDDVRKKDQQVQGKRLHLTKGVHLVVEKHKLPLTQTIYFDNADGRMIFAVPRGEAVYLGTTDTDFLGEKDSPEVTMEDVKYILKACNDMFPNAHLTVEDVDSSWAGLRPLIHEDGKDPSELSRKDEIFYSESGLISIAGGKLTGYRKMSERVVDQVALKVNKPIGKCITDSIQVDGGSFESYEDVQLLIKDLQKRFDQLLPGYADAEYLVHNYGTDAETILQSAMDSGEDLSMALVWAETNYAIDSEMVMSSLDFFERRTGRLNFRIGSISKIRETVTKLMAKKLKWNKERVVKENLLLDKALLRVRSFTLPK
ncbi:MAG: glycerol-3-phosphate dehydrogenase [Flavobacteriales bacterium]|jgi:glycerol-3-phosphate dehydrogenase